MRLVDLQARFVRPSRRADQNFIVEVEDIGKARGVMFLCPKCYAANGGPRRTHRIICWTPAVPMDIRPGPGRWNLVGTGLHDLSLVAGSSSVKLEGGCEWHGFVTNGEVTTC